MARQLYVVVLVPTHGVVLIQYSGMLHTYVQHAAVAQSVVVSSYLACYYTLHAMWCSVLFPLCVQAAQSEGYPRCFVDTALAPSRPCPPCSKPKPVTYLMPEEEIRYQ